ncbi:MAG: hypothetical protein GXY13_09740 [Acidimicrobiales bacterium]|nr:hypothetical protein [Acidimicrobiales bacterium]
MQLSDRTRAVGLALCAWTLITWVTRVPLAWRDDELETAEKVLATVPVVLFVALAAVAGATTIARRTVAGGALMALAGWSAAYWAVRVPMIAVNDHPAAFIVVHAVLGGVAVGLAGLTLRGLLADRSRAGVAAG